MKGIVKFNEKRCKGCELCMAACPKKIIQLQDKLNQKGYHPVGIENMDECVGCGNCGLMCPDGVISVYQENESNGQ